MLFRSAAIDFGTKKGASSAAGFINGAGSVGAILGGTAPGWIDGGKGHDPWQIIFLGLGGALALAAALLVPRWNELPPTGLKEPALDTASAPSLAREA